jgi:hypothetical protein
LQQVWDIDTPKRKSGYLLPSQQLNLEDHATSDIHLLGLFLYGGFGQRSTDVVESCCGVAPHTLYAGRVTFCLKPFKHANNVALTYNSILFEMADSILVSCVIVTTICSCAT